MSMDYEVAVGFMEGGHTDFWIMTNENAQSGHVAFRAKDQASVDDFYKEALAAGGTDNGAPGYRTDYSPGYYAAFIHDADKNNIEVVWFDPSKEK
jgi:predicted lactoylglutathione lyase